jgi:hypothetical protein
MIAWATTKAWPRPVGDVSREWRQRRRLSQLDLALEAEISTRHLKWRAHLFERLRRQIDVSADAFLVELLKELQGYPAPANSAHAPKGPLTGTGC